ncbi:MAG TPA: hypothetical protein VKV02_11830, partial [Acidobacteriaceae bacterium]|nr:hypothetical protein [Acidobacteriaceae bacterium]
MASTDQRTQQEKDQRCSPEASATTQSAANTAPETPTRLDDVVSDTQKQAASPSQPAPAADPAQQAKQPGGDDDVVGKVYDSRLMRRLIRYLSPYKLQAFVSAVAIFLKSGSDVFGPYLVKVAVDTYLAPTPGKHSWLSRHLSPVPITGVTEIGGLYLCALCLSFLLEFVQTYLMQWTGQKIMF